MTRRRWLLLAGAVLGLLVLYGMVGYWIGIHQAVAGPRTPGTVSDVRCGVAYRGGTVCSGDFTSNDGTRRERSVRVEGLSNPARGPVPVFFVPRIPTGLTGTIQSDDTAYAGRVSLSLVVPLIIAVVLTILAIPWNLAFAIIGAAALMRWRGPGRPRRPGFRRGSIRGCLPPFARGSIARPSCSRRTTPGCPTGTYPDDGTSRRD